ncbi:alpha/beta hydrolase [Terrihabitans rhizophilus]|uniref:Alpha/beta hydrolase n=1 Tax=Terrihabitans rhizophilus TaxID=3092662 RepID=A0ABU4RPX2_9HYPH|nr:alpha/beta hydrolase [Terrihabitans sp. PJ23]MDX6806238.1 alpha/beta hydrolase [Terrihabitans sp. PJ23]
MSSQNPASSPWDRWASLGQAERDAAYNNNAAVADSPALIEARNAASAIWRNAHPQGLDVAYGHGERTAFDLYPAADPSAPCLVFIHGGYWQKNSRENFAAYAEGLARSGWSVAMPSHTLAPEASLTQIAAEIREALDWLASSGPANGISGPLVLSGWSAGAQLAALHLDHPAVTAGLAISGVYELAPLRDTFLNQALRLTDDEIATLSPLRRPVCLKPMAIAYGCDELPALVHDSLRLHQLREQASAPGALIALPGADHFTVLDQFRTLDGVLVRAAKEVLALARKGKAAA